MAKIEVISSCLVKTPTNGHKTAMFKTLELTPWDLQYLLHEPIQKGILFYKPDPSRQLPETLIDHLKNSLSNTLVFFPLLLGRLGTIRHGGDATSFFIDCNDAGAEFIHAVADAVSVSDVLEPKHMPEIVSSFFPLNFGRNYEGVSLPLLRVQVTELMDGIFVGCTANHVVVDGASFWHFFNSWSEISRGLGTISKAPVFERQFTVNRPLLDRNLLDDKFFPPPLLERVFHFSQDSLAKLKAKANSEAGNDKISTLQALSAHLWRCIVRSRRQQNTNNKTSKDEVYLILPVGARARIPLPDGYFGCAVNVAKTAINEHELLQNRLGFAALKINELVSQQTRETIIKSVEDWAGTPPRQRKGRLNFVVGSSPRFDVYGCDFGWGKPIAVRSGRAQKYDGKITMYGAAEPGGIDVEVCLAPETLKAVEDDADFIEFVTI